MVCLATGMFRASSFPTACEVSFVVTTEASDVVATALLPIVVVGVSVGADMSNFSMTLLPDVAPLSFVGTAVMSP